VPPREETAYRLAKLIKKARRQMSNAIRSELEPLAVSLPVVQVLKHVASSRDLSQLELAQELELEPGALSRLLTNLEEQKLVKRRRDPTDKRRVLMTTTPAAKALLGRAQPRVLAGLDRMFSRITPSERDELCRVLEKLSRDDVTPVRPHR
jgi:MarR family transcriptional regulator, organic hydroperoxide resistance regulator